MAENTFPFRRMTKALLVPVVVTPTAQTALAVPDGFIKQDYNAFHVTNPNNCWVSLRGTSLPEPMGMPVPTAPNIVALDGTDWLWPPGFVGVYTTQYPLWMSAAALPMPGYPVDENNLVPIRMHYGFGS